MRKRIGIIMVIIFVVLCAQFIWLSSIGYFDYLKERDAYFINNEDFNHSTSLLDEEYTATINPRDLVSYKDKIIIQNDLFRIRVDEIEIDEHSNIKLYFYIDNNDNFGGGELIYISNIEDNLIFDNDDFEITTNTGISNTTSMIGEGPFTREGYYAGVYINFDEEVDWEFSEDIEITFHYLMINEYTKK